MIGGKDKTNQWTKSATYFDIEWLQNNSIEQKSLKDLPSALIGPTLTHTNSQKGDLILYVAGCPVEDPDYPKIFKFTDDKVWLDL